MQEVVVILFETDIFGWCFFVDRHWQCINRRRHLQFPCTKQPGPCHWLVAVLMHDHLYFRFWIVSYQLFEKCGDTGSDSGPTPPFSLELLRDVRGIDGGGSLISPDGVVPTRIVGVSASCYPAQHHKVQKKLSSGTGCPSWCWKKGRKTIVMWWVVVTTGCHNAFCALTLLVGHQDERLACKNWVMRCWHGYLSRLSWKRGH